VEVEGSDTVLELDEDIGVDMLLADSMEAECNDDCSIASWRIWQSSETYLII
jgi:hypothetical protein